MITERAREHAAENGWEIDPTWRNPYWRRTHHKEITGAVGMSERALNDALDHDDKCGECGTWIEYSWSSESKHSPPVRPTYEVCFSCSFYRRHVAEFSARHLVVENPDGSRSGYAIAEATHPGAPHYNASTTSTPGKGHGGRRFVVLFHRGERVVTHDLWCWAPTIPPHFHDRLPINAIFEVRASSLQRVVDAIVEASNER